MVYIYIYVYIYILYIWCVYIYILVFLDTFWGWIWIQWTWYLWGPIECDYPGLFESLHPCWLQHYPRPEWYAVGWLMSWFSWLLLGITSCALQPVVCFWIAYRLYFFLCGFVLIQKPWWVNNASIDFHTRGHQRWGIIWPSGLMPMNKLVNIWQMLMLQFSVFTAMLVKSLGIFSLFPWFLFNQSLMIGWIRIPSWLLLFLNTL